MTRATSTVVDVTLFLLLVGGAITVTLGGATVERSTTGNPAIDRAELLGASTASVEYALRVPGPAPGWYANASASERRTAHGTVAELLREAAMSAVTIDGTRLSTAGVGFERAVENRTRRTVRTRGHRTAVSVDWEPYRNATVNGRVRVGPRPPPTTDVNAATLTLDSGMETVPERALTAGRIAGYSGVASVVARTIVHGLFPPDRTRLALHGDYPANRLTTQRYRQTATITGATVSVAEQSPETMNRELASALADSVERDLREEFRSPAAAAQAIDTSTVRITVRTWSP